MSLEVAKARLPYLDWLRIIIVMMLVPFHTAMTFATYPWFLQNNELSQPLQGLIMAMDRYQMPLLFLIAGGAVYFSLGLRDWKGYTLERAMRLSVPLVFGMLVLVPACYWVAAQNQYHYEGAIWEYYPVYWQQNMLPSATAGAFKPGVLWFLWYLVIYVIVCSPFFILLRKKAGDGFFNRLGRPFESPWAIFALFIPIAILQVFSGNRIVGWALADNFKVFYHLLFFIYGFFIFSSGSYMKGINKAGPAAVVTAVLTMSLFMLSVYPNFGTAPLGAKFWSGLHVALGTAGYFIGCLMALCNWSCIIALLYLARRYNNFSNRFVQYGNDAVLPYYVFHGTAIALIGFWIVDLPWGVWPKYGLIVVLAFAATIAFYELMKQFSVTRFLLGMRLKKEAPAHRRGVLQSLAVNFLSVAILIPLALGIVHTSANLSETSQSTVTTSPAQPGSSPVTPSDTGKVALNFATDNYTNENLGFSIAYPHSWTTMDVQAARGVFLAMADQRLPLLTIAVYDADIIEQQQRDSLQFQKLTNIRSEGPQPYTLSDGKTPGLYVSVRMTHPQVDLISRSVYIKKEGKVIVFSVVSADGYEPPYVNDIFRTIVFYK
jgi:glucan biosynthesis protein C